MYRNVMIYSDEEDKAIIKHCRGYRYVDVYIDNSLKNNEDAMGWIIMKLVPPSYDKDYKWRDHVFYFN